MKFASIVAPLAILVFLLGHAESTIDDLLDQAPNEVNDVVAAYLEDMEPMKTVLRLPRSRGTLEITSTLSTESEYVKGSVYSNILENSEILISFLIGLPKQQLNGNLVFIKGNENYTATFTSAVENYSLFNFDIVSGLVSRKFTVNGLVTKYPANPSHKLKWTSTQPTTRVINDIQAKMTSLFTDSYINQLKEKLSMAVEESKTDLIEIFHDLYKKK